jgi:hypothetical protein
VIGPVDFGKRFEEFSTVAPPVGLWSQECEALSGITEESRHVIGQVRGCDLVNIPVTFFTPGACRGRNAQQREHRNDKRRAKDS